MNPEQADNTAKFTSIDDIINFYTQALQDSNSQKEDLDKEETNKQQYHEEFQDLNE